MSPRDRPSEARFSKLLVDLAHWLDRANVKGAVIGGVAASLRGRPRFTRDVDAVVLAGDGEWESFLESGSRSGFFPRIADVIDFAQTARVLLLRHEPTDTDVDISLGSLPFERELIARATVVELAGAGVPIATAEDLVIMKALARRPRDIADIESLLSMNRELDLDRVRRWLREFSSVLDMPEISDEFEAVLRKVRRST